MVSFVLSRVPAEWKTVHEYKESFLLFELDIYSNEYQTIEQLFQPTLNSININSIRRVQNPFQYGRFKLRQEMLKTSREVDLFDYF